MSAKNSQRTNFALAKHTPEYPDFLDIQIKSFQDFFQLEDYRLLNLYDL